MLLSMANSKMGRLKLLELFCFRGDKDPLFRYLAWFNFDMTPRWLQESRRSDVGDVLAR